MAQGPEIWQKADSSAPPSIHLSSTDIESMPYEIAKDYMKKNLCICVCGWVGWYMFLQVYVYTRGSHLGGNFSRGHREGIFLKEDNAGNLWEFSYGNDA